AADNHNLDVIWPVGLRNTSDRAYTWPDGTTDDDKARVFREVIGLQTAMVRDALPPGRTPIFHFTMYSEMLDLYRRDPKAFGLPDDVIIVWPDDNDGHMRGLPDERGRWKHGVYYHLAYLAYHALLDTPDKLWYASEAVQNLIERLWHRANGTPFTPFNADTQAVLRSRIARLDSALAREAEAGSALNRTERRFLSIDVGLGLGVDERQTRAALTLADALQAPDSTTMWRLVRRALAPLEPLETEFARREYPPFDRWYGVTWIRAGLQ